MSETVTDAEMKENEEEKEPEKPKEGEENAKPPAKGLKSKEEELLEAFKIYDRNGDGFISVDELKLVMKNMGEDLDDDDIDMIIGDNDLDNDGKLSYQEFVKMMTGQ
mmetsp:Transcript_6655/g.16569  ORF Transcript_6655/g.16569 Transcript_6655/m.16569 type:complete len:107 (+) Transcript_6655:89-409(+)